MAKPAAVETEGPASLEVALSDVTGLYVALGFKTAETWDRAMIGKKLPNLGKAVKQAGNTRDSLTDEQSDLLDNLLNAIDEGVSITLTEEEDGEPVNADGTDPEPEAEADAPAPAKGGKPAAAPTAPAKGGKPAAAKAAPKPPEKKHTMNRVEVTAVTIMKRKSWAMDDLFAAADEAYVAVGGNANEKESKWATKIALQVLTATEHVSVADGKVTRNS